MPLYFAQHISHDLDTLRFHFLLGSTHILDLEANDGTVVELVIATFGSEDLKQLPDANSNCTNPVCHRERAEVQGCRKRSARTSSDRWFARPPTYTQAHAPASSCSNGGDQMAAGASEYHLYPNEIGTTEGNDVRGYFQPTASERNS